MTEKSREQVSDVDNLVHKLEQLEPGLTSHLPQNQFSELVLVGEKSLPELLEALKHENPEVRLDAAEALGQLKQKARKALNALKKVVEADNDGTVKQTAAISLIQIGGDDLLAEVTKNLKDKSPEVVAHAAVTLGKVGNPRVVPNLLEAFQTEDQLIGSAVAWALGRLADSRAIEWLASALENGFVPANAAEALGRIRDPEAIPILIRCLKSRHIDARAYAARALGMMKEPTQLSGIRAHKWFQLKEGMIDALREILANDTEQKVRIFSSIALFELGDRKAGKTFLSLLREI